MEQILYINKTTGMMRSVDYTNQAPKTLAPKNHEIIFRMPAGESVDCIKKMASLDGEELVGFKDKPLIPEPPLNLDALSIDESLLKVGVHPDKLGAIKKRIAAESK